MVGAIVAGGFGKLVLVIVEHPCEFELGEFAFQQGIGAFCFHGGFPYR
jgi:hypothetical protein